MRVIPVLDLMGGKAVHARRGDRANYRPVESLLAPGTADPLRLAAAFRAAGFTELYVADLDAILGTGSHLDTVARVVAATGLRVMVDSGLRRAGDAEPWLAAGATVVAGSETLARLGEVAALTGAAGPERVVFSLDLRGGAVLSADPDRAGDTPEQWLAAAAGAGVRTATLIELQAVGSEGGPPLDLARRLTRAVPGMALLVGGGVRDEADLERLSRAGVAGALVGTALHNGSLGRAGLAEAERNGAVAMLPVEPAGRRDPQVHRDPKLPRGPQAPRDRVTITGMQFFGRHGVYRHEMERGQIFVVDVELRLDLRPATRDDALSATVDYSEVFDHVRAVVEGPTVKLIETLAERIADRILAHCPPVVSIGVRVHKPHAPLPGAFADVAVAIERQRRA